MTAKFSASIAFVLGLTVLTAGANNETVDINSPRLAKLARELQTGNRDALSVFWKEVQDKAPLEEALAADKDHVRATFVWQGSNGTTRVTRMGGLPGSNLLKPLLRLADTDLWYLTEVHSTQARFQYVFQINGPESPPMEMSAITTEMQRNPPRADPLNTRQYAGWSYVELTEFGYQYEPGCESNHGYTTRQVHQPATVRKKAWKIATAGGFFAAGFSRTAVSRNISPDDVNNFRPASLEVLYDFFTKRTEYWKMSPHLELVASHNVLLALPGSEYVAYFPRGGTNHIKLAAGSYRMEWLHPETGRYFEMPRIDVPDCSREFVPPERPNDDWVLHLRQSDGP